MYAPNFNLAAHIEANTVNGVFRPPVNNPTTEIRPTGAVAAEPPVGKTNIDWLAWLDTNQKAFNTVQERLNSSTLLKVPTAGSKEWEALMEETGGAAANPGFNYAAHVAAITSQKVLKGLTEAEVLTLIAETGRTNFSGFDLQAHETAKQKVIQLAERAIGKFTIASTSSSASGGVVSDEDLKVAEKMLLGSDSADVIDESETTSTKTIIAGGAAHKKPVRKYWQISPNPARTEMQ